MSYTFLIVLAFLVSAQAYIATRVGLRPITKAILSILAIIVFGSVLGDAAAYLAPRESLRRAVIFYITIICIEDWARTRYVVLQVRNGVSVITASLAFSIVISVTETLIQNYDLLLVAWDKSMGTWAEGEVEILDEFFSSYSASLATLAIYVIRPIFHFLLSMALYHTWITRNYIAYGLLIASHIALGIIINELNEDILNDPVQILGATSLLMVALYFPASRARIVTARS